LHFAHNNDAMVSIKSSFLDKYLGMSGSI